MSVARTLLLVLCLLAVWAPVTGAAWFRTTAEPAVLEFDEADEATLTVRFEGATYCAAQPDHGFWVAGDADEWIEFPETEVYLPWRTGASPGLMTIDASLTWTVTRRAEADEAFNATTQWTAYTPPFNCPVVNEPQGRSYQTVRASGPARQIELEAPGTPPVSPSAAGPSGTSPSSPAAAVVTGFFTYVAALGAAVAICLRVARGRGK